MSFAATYRLQLHAGFTFDDAAAIAPYLARLGVSHVYASPVATARSGSAHGYDVVDATRINPELGGEAGFVRLAEALRRQGLRLLLDIVPNHMGVGGADNGWWLDVLEHGRTSAYAGFFDIDWDPPDPALAGKVAAPFLGAPYGEALAAGDIVLKGGAEDLSAWAYGHHRLPIRPQDRPEALAAGPAAFDPANAEGRARLHALLERQHWRLAWWRTAGDEINWRRFFDITELAALRIEDPAVFDAVHALPLRLYAEGLVDGLRVDHVDGLADPGGYCARLRGELDARRPGGWLVVEKILAPGETLDPAWGCDGDTGYAFMDEVGALLHDPAGAAALTALWREASGRALDFHAEERAARLELIDRAFAGQLAAAARAFHRLARSDLATRDLTQAALARTLTALLAAFPAYRTYAQGRPAGEADRARLAAALEGARPLIAPGEGAAARQAAEWLAGAGPGDPALAAEAARRFQQLSAPLAAKSVEDTAFYRYGRLLSRNEVGADPGRFSLEPAGFHAAAARRGRETPRALIATATHDHKRGEDVRARLAVLSEYAQDWAEAVGRWRAASGAAGAGIAGGDEAQLYQTLLGAWPPGLAADDAAGLGAYGERVLGWWRKALREAKLATSWTAPDAGYEAACEAFLARLTGSAALYPLRAEIAAFAARIEAAGRANGLVQAFLKCVCPGAPDIYQGCEFADLSLVDPDNRRPVDYAARAAALERGARASPAAALAAGDYDGAKQGLIAGALAARRAHADAFAGADYAPLAASGPRAAHVLAFRRGPVVCAAAIRTARALEGRATPPADWWGETAIEVPGPWRDPLSGTEGWGTEGRGTEGERGDGRGGAAPARELFAALPVALILPR